MMHALVLAQRAAVARDDRAARVWRLHAGLLHVRAQERRVIAVGNETDFLAVALFSHRQVEGPRQLAHRGLGHLAQRKQRARELRLGEAEQKIGLILGGIHRAQQLVPAARVIIADAGIVPGSHLPGPHRIGHLEETVELDVVVTERARDGRAAGQVLGHERLHHAFLELLLEIDHVVGNADLLRHAAGIVDIFDRAAAAGGSVRRQIGQPPLVPELHRQPDHALPLADQQRGHRGAVHAARHRHRNRRAVVGDELRHGPKPKCGAGVPPRLPEQRRAHPPRRRYWRGPAKNACWRGRDPRPGRWR